MPESQPVKLELQPGRVRPIRVMVVDDLGIVRHAVASVLESMRGVEVLGLAGSGEQLLSMLEGAQPDVVITELGNAGLRGIELTAQIRRRYPDIQVLVLSRHEDAQVVRRAVQAGASGYVPKGAGPEELEAALRTIVATGSYFSASIMRLMLQRAAPTAQEELTPRQLEILTLIANGKCSKEIGSELGLSFKTVDVHRVRMTARLGITSVAELTRYALRHGLVQA